MLIIKWSCQLGRCFKPSFPITFKMPPSDPPCSVQISHNASVIKIKIKDKNKKEQKFKAKKNFSKSKERIKDHAINIIITLSLRYEPNSLTLQITCGTTKFKTVSLTISRLYVLKSKVKKRRRISSTCILIFQTSSKKK